MGQLADHQILGLTVHSPYGELIADGVKPVECRTWAPHPEHLGRYLAIHQSTRWDQEGYEFIGRNHQRFKVDAPRPEHCKAGIIAVARLVGWVQRVEGDRPPKVIAMLPDHAFGGDDWRWFASGDFGWVLRGVVRIAPVAIKGRQGLWVLPPLAYQSVRQRWRRATGPLVAPRAPHLRSHC